MHRHRWEVIELTGLVAVQRCQTCGKTRIRVLSLALSCTVLHCEIG